MEGLDPLNLFLQYPHRRVRCPRAIFMGSSSAVQYKAAVMIRILVCIFTGKPEENLNLPIL